MCALDCWWFVGCMFCHIGLKTIIIEISSYMICQKYWKRYHWQSEQDCGICIKVLRHILAVLCEMFSVSWLMGRQRRTHCMASILARFESSEFLPMGNLNTLVYASPVDNEEAPHHRILDACPSIRNYPCISERMRLFMKRRVSRALNLKGDILSTYYKCTLSTITN
jgi:hypothetical protein